MSADNSPTLAKNQATSARTTTKRRRWAWFFGLYITSVVIIGGVISFLHWLVMTQLPGR